jgi:hypothetical protein
MTDTGDAHGFEVLMVQGDQGLANNLILCEAR